MEGDTQHYGRSTARSTERLALAREREFVCSHHTASCGRRISFSKATARNPTHQTTHMSNVIEWHEPKNQNKLNNSHKYYITHFRFLWLVRVTHFHMRTHIHTCVHTYTQTHAHMHTHEHTLLLHTQSEKHVKNTTMCTYVTARVPRLWWRTVLNDIDPHKCAWVVRTQHEDIWQLATQNIQLRNLPMNSSPHHITVGE